MSVTIHVTLITKEGCFDDFYALAKTELAFTRGFEGCHAVYISSSKDTNTLKFIEIWDSEDAFDLYFTKRAERSGEDFGKLLEEPPSKECFQTDNWGYGPDWKI